MANKYHVSATIDADVIDEIKRRGLCMSQYFESLARADLWKSGNTEPKAVEGPSNEDKAMLADVLKKLRYDRYTFERGGNMFTRDQENSIIAWMKIEHSRKIDFNTIYKLTPEDFGKPVLDPYFTDPKEIVAAILKYQGYTPLKYRCWGNHFDIGCESAIITIAKDYYGLKLTREQIYELLPDEYTRA